MRLTEAFGTIQAELASCEALMRSDENARVRDGYATLVSTLRQHAGERAKQAWRTPPVAADEDIGMGDVHDALQTVRDEQQRFEQQAACATGPWLRRVFGV